MPAGTIHRRDTTWASIAAISVSATYVLTSYRYTNSWSAINVALYLPEFLFGLLWWGKRITPDWDQEANVSLLVRPYAELMPHRSIWSHGPIISTLLRVLYVASSIWVAGAFCLTLYSIWQYSTSNFETYVMEYLWTWTVLWIYLPWDHIGLQIAGLMLADIIHWIADGFPV